MLNSSLLVYLTYTGGSETRFAAMRALSWSNFATSCSRPMKLLHYVSQAPHTNICNSNMHKDLQNAAISLNESNSWRRLTTKEHTWLKTWFQTPLCLPKTCTELDSSTVLSLVNIWTKYFTSTEYKYHPLSYFVPFASG